MFDGGPVDAVEERVTRDGGGTVDAAQATAVIHDHKSANENINK